jgi:hypothetical protein
LQRGKRRRVRERERYQAQQRLTNLLVERDWRKTKGRWKNDWVVEVKGWRSKEEYKSVVEDQLRGRDVEYWERKVEYEGNIEDQLRERGERREYGGKNGG